MAGKQMAKATIEMTEGAKLSVRAQFNPKELTITKAVSWNQHRGAAKDEPMVQFTTGQPKKLSVSLFFDGYEEARSIKPECEKLIKMAEMDKELHRPSEVKFAWKDLVFLGVIDNVSVAYQMFLASGEPCRATVTLSMQRAKPQRQDMEATQTESPDFAKMHTVKRGETLHHIAAIEYDSPSEWRRIADANGIDDPLDVPPGTKLLLPPIL